MKKKIKTTSYNIFHRILSKLLRKFWTHCPKCHQYFAGYHKFGHQIVQKDNLGNMVNYRIVCHRCHKDHIKLEHK